MRAGNRRIVSLPVARTFHNPMALERISMRSVVEWLEYTAARTPDKTAVISPDGSLTFQQLLEQARAYGTWLAGRDVQRRAVALYAEKSPAVLAVMLGTAYAGGFYSVIDVRQPIGRVRSICDTLDPVVVLTDAQHLDTAETMFDCTGYDVTCIEDIISTPVDERVLENVRAGSLDVDPLYVNFTSGSTGVPKGVIVSHRSVLDFIPVFDDTFGIGEHEIIGNQAPFDFDVSVKDIYSCLYTGATLRLIPRDFFSQPMVLMDYLCDSHVTTLIWAVSAMCFVSIMNGFEYRVPNTVRKVIFSGEVMPPKQLNIWRKYLPDALYVNVYGPTEITCNCTYYIVDREFGKKEVIPIGRAFPNEKVFLLDDNDRLITDAGQEGEIVVSGTCLGLGYLNMAERTAASFVQNPINNRWTETVYRTGDLARYDEDGNLVYSTRKDFQIKYMGQRIELGDIEASAQAVDGVSRACCLYDAHRKRIILFYVGPILKNDLFHQLKVALPQYMVPSKIFAVDEMPLTKNGKVDRTALGVIGGIKG